MDARCRRFCSFTRLLRASELLLVLIQYFPINLFFSNPLLIAFHCYDEQRWTLAFLHTGHPFSGYNTLWWGNGVIPPPHRTVFRRVDAGGHANLTCAIFFAHALSTHALFLFTTHFSPRTSPPTPSTTTRIARECQDSSWLQSWGTYPTHFGLTMW